MCQADDRWRAVLSFTEIEMKGKTMIYAGYGIDTRQIKKDDIKNMSIHQETDIDEIIKNEEIAQYLRDIINTCEADKCGEDVVSAYGTYLVFANIRFAEDNSHRSKYIKSEEDFIEMLGRYIPTNDLIFGNVYTGSEWDDDFFYMY